MPYTISKPELDALGNALTAYYEEAWQEGVKGLFDRMAQSQMGIVSSYLDQAKDTWANLRRSSNDKFGVTFKPALKQFVSVHVANRADVATILVQAAEKGLNALTSHIPVPMVGTVLDMAISLGSKAAQDELHTRSIAEADGHVAAKTGEAVGKFFTSDVEAGKFITKSIDQYKLIASYIKTLPTTITTFDDAVAFPSAVFKVQAAASSLNVALVSVRQYLAGMQERLERVQTVSKDYIAKVRTDMPAAANAVLQAGYLEGYKSGESDIRNKKFHPLPEPKFQKPAKTGGATLLAAYLAHAVSLGYYESGNRGPMQAGAPPFPQPIRR